MKALRLLTVILLALYMPLETWVSWPALYHPMYLIDLVGMLLLLWGVMRARSESAGAGAILAAGWAWTAANVWRGTEKRFIAHASGLTLEFGPVERWIGVALTILTIAMAGLALRVAVGRRA